MLSILAFILIVIVVIVQQNVASALIGSKPAPAAPAAAVIEPPSGQFEIMTKVFVKAHAAMSDASVKTQLGSKAIETLRGMAKEPEEEMRVAMIAAELTGEREALTQLDEIKLKPDSPLESDRQVLRDLYSGGSLNAAGQLQLETNHRWIGRLAATHGKPDSDPERSALVSGGTVLLTLLTGVAVGFCLLLLAGFALMIVGIVLVANGTIKPRFIPPSPGGSLPIELAVVFILGFLLLKGVSVLAEQLMPPVDVMWVALIAQWCLLFILLWPRIRAGKGSLKAMGWNTGEGVFKEIGCGITGYIACLPLVVVAALISVVLMVVYQLVQERILGKPPAAPASPVFELASGRGGIGIIVVIYLLASVWAPIMEETIFRGALYRHLRGKWAWFPAAAVSALAFGFMHNYPVPMLGTVIALGFGFAMMREWRGSLVACMTGHCLHNGVVLGVLLLVVHLIG